MVCIISEDNPERFRKRLNQIFREFVWFFYSPCFGDITGILFLKKKANDYVRSTRHIQILEETLLQSTSRELTKIQLGR